jgi:hypothetical protein
MKNYERQPIKLSHHSVAIIKLFKRTDYFEDSWSEEFDDIQEWLDGEKYESAANQFVKQLEGEWNIKFMEELHNKIESLIKEHDKDYGTEFYKDLHK